MVDAPPDLAVRSFPAVSAIDTCAVWNILCSRTLNSATKGQNRHFVLADYVRYECLVKRRSNGKSEIEASMQRQLSAELEEGRSFSVHQLAVGDLLELVTAVGSPRRFDKGEFAALALARKLNNGFLTDDRAAKRVGESVVGTALVRTTPHLVGWLVFAGCLVDGDIPTIIKDNKVFRGDNGHLGQFIQKSYEHALGLRLCDRLAR
ncbi:MAG: hypothetical protein H7841_07020 [Magnetospirillum sp. WYHS-4]